MARPIIMKGNGDAEGAGAGSDRNMDSAVLIGSSSGTDDDESKLLPKPLAATGEWARAASGGGKAKLGAGLIAAIGAVAAGAYVGKLIGHAVAGTLVATAATAVAGWLVVRQTRQWICFTCFFQCHWDYRVMRRKARQLQAAAAAEGREVPPEQLRALWDESHNRCAKRAYDTVSNLHGLWVKMAQMLATRRDLMPEIYCVMLGKAQDGMPAAAVSEVEKVIARELGRPLTEIFADFHEKPLGCASIAQVRVQLIGHL